MLQRVFVLALGLALVGQPAAGQAVAVADFGAGGAELSRSDLERLLAQYQAAMESPAYSSRLRAAAKTNAERVSERLRVGDFQPGDRVAISVQGEPNLPDTVAVELGPKVVLPLFGEISLAGVLRSEITDHLTRELGKVIKDPVVRAQGLMRISIQGAVGSPGFFVVPADMLVTEALMRAGGPASGADLSALKIERGTSTLIQGADMQDALIKGRTLDQLSLQAGDQIVLPTEKSYLGFLGRFLLGVGSFLLVGTRIF